MTLEILTLTYPEKIELCFAIRRQVFIKEQDVREDEEIDGLDPECIHFLALSNQKPVATARLRPHTKSVAKAERVAVIAPYRGQGFGAAIMRELEKIAEQKNFEEILLGSQLSAIPFYESLGYQVEGEVFLDARIPHKLMRKKLTL